MRKGKAIFRRVQHFALPALSVIAGLLIACIASAAEPGDSIGPGEESAAATTPEIVYKLMPSSNFYQGCTGSCLCPVLNAGEIRGTFDLTPLAPGPLFNQYSVTSINWTVVNHFRKIVHRIKGNGFYEVGGEVAVTQQMVLHLRIDGKQAVTFDSGPVVGQSRFPDISMAISSGNTCYKVWMNINAVPK